MLFLWPQVAWHALRPGDLFRAPQPLSEWNFETQVCSGLCCVWPLAEDDKHMDMPMSVHRPFGHGSSVSGGRWSDVPRAHLSTPPAYPRCGAGSRVACQGLSPQFHFGGTVCIYSHWGYNEGPLTPVETELSLCNGVIQAFWADQKREQSQAKLRIQELPPDLCPLGRFKTVFWERRAVCGAWCRYDITLTDFDTFMLDLHQCYPEWHLALLVLINHRSWHSSVSPVRWWGSSKSEACALNAEQMKHCSLHQSFVEPDAAWSPSVAFWHLWVHRCFDLASLYTGEKEVVCNTGFARSWWLF